MTATPQQSYITPLTGNPLYDRWEEERKDRFEHPKPHSQHHWAMHYSYAIPSEEALTTIAKYSPILEVGAGTGYWAALLAAKGADIVASDVAPPVTGNNKYTDIVSYFAIQRLDAPHAPAAYPGRTLFLCYPPYNSTMAHRAIAMHRGRVIYVGEDYGGNCADDGFFDTLRRHWEQVEFLTLPNWPGLHTELTVWERKP